MSAPAVVTMTDAELHAEMRAHLGDKSAQRWQWVRYEGERITGLAYEAGTARGEGVTERQALEAIVTANRRQHERRSAAANKAAHTRAKRREQAVYRMAAHLKAGGALKPAERCCFCRRALTDAESIARGIGAECWQGVLSAMEGGK